MIPFIERFGWSWDQIQATPPDLLEEMAERWNAEHHWTGVKEDLKAQTNKQLERRHG